MKKILLSLLLTVIYAQGTFSGVTYFDYTYDLSEDAINDDGFGLKRVYFTYQETLSENISYKFQTDVGQLKIDDVSVEDDGNVSVSTDKTQFVAYLKKAQLDWKTSFGKLTFGMQGMNVFNVTEKTWGFRFLQKSPMDKYKFSSSADLGIGLSGKYASNLHYSILCTNGSGYKKGENDKHKKISFQLVHGEKNLVKKDGAHIGYSLTVEPYDSKIDDNENTVENKILMGAYGGFAKNGLRIGGEFDVYTDDGSDISKQIIAGYASYKLSDKFEGLIYVDMYDPNTSINKDGNTDMILGINCRPEKGLTITPNIRISNPEEGDSNKKFMLNFEFKF